MFRYALERWPGAPYEVTVFHRGPLPEPERRALDFLRGFAADPDAMPCIEIGVVDTTQAMSPHDSRVWEAAGRPAAASIAVSFPAETGVDGVPWQAPLSDLAVEQLMLSPLRRDIARRLLQTDSVVFVAAEGADAAENARLVTELTAHLRTLEKELRLPEPDASGETGPDAVYVDEDQFAQLRIAFSVATLARNDPKEHVLSALFSFLAGGAERGPGEEPPFMFFAIFGRGRALGPFGAENVNERHLRDICGFLTGPCSCTAKAMNPGVDLLFDVDWDGLLSGRLIVDAEMPPLAGFSELLDEAPAAGKLPLFRHALLNWDADTYQAIVFHKDALSAAHMQWVDSLTRDDREGGQPAARLDVAVVDAGVRPKIPYRWRQVWDELQEPPLPCVVVCHGAAGRASKPGFVGALGADTAAKLAGSPVRREIARRILAGAAAVFVVLETGAGLLDEQAVGKLARLLPDQEQDMVLPSAPDRVARQARSAAHASRPRFSAIRLQRADPDEPFLVGMLSTVGRRAGITSRPLVFPVFGRGRCLPPLRGDDLAEADLREVCRYIVGLGYDEDKARNPGVDLMMGVDWNAFLAGERRAEADLAPARVFWDIRAPEPEGIERSASGARAGMLKRNLLLAGLALVILVAAGTCGLNRK
ncbi:MAG: hypothetical protein JXR37_27245 [Kiritimatiellae bacterium]|nr:hypothetical protein [Kiritimatiellia bacterium]